VPLDNEKKVLKKLGIETWRNLSKEKFMGFVAIMPEVSDKVRMKIIEQVPQFTKLCGEGLNTAKEAFQKVLDKNEKTTAVLIEKIDGIRESISNEQSRDGLSVEERRHNTEQLMEIAQIYNKMDERNKKFFETIFGKLLIAIGLFLGLAIVFVGGTMAMSDNEDDFWAEND